MGEGLSLTGGELAIVAGLLSTMSLAVVALYRRILQGHDAHIRTLEHELSLSQQREQAWRQAAFDWLPIAQSQSEVAAEAFTLAKKRGIA